jgi:uncharacterized Zn finger protein
MDEKEVSVESYIERKDLKCPECGAGPDDQVFEVVDWNEQAIYFSCKHCGQQSWSVDGSIVDRRS